MLRQGRDCCPGHPQGAVFAGAPEDLQARHQAGPQAGAKGRVCGCAQGGLLKVQDQPKEGQEARHQEMVLRPI